jgi:hypothetical protein
VVNVPAAWMPAVAMKRIHVHWTAGHHTANSTDKNAYHILIQGDGTLVRGNKSIAANAQGSGMSQASHTRAANTGAIGVSMCCMASAVENPFSSGPSPMTQVQWNAMTDVVAALAKRYAILVTRPTILTHAEVQPTLNIMQNNKWDITRLSFDLSVVGHYPVGDRMRAEVAAKLDGVMPSNPGMPPGSQLPRFRVRGVTPSTLNVRDAPAGTKIGELPEGTRVERLAMSQGWWQVRTPGGHVGWVSSEFLVAIA